jgi:hypothetical protein
MRRADDAPPTRCCWFAGRCDATDRLRQLYPALLKRLDDSSDDVRKAVCTTFGTFLRTSPPKNFVGTILDYSVEQLLVHLDDQDPAIQQVGGMCCFYMPAE